MRYLGGKLRIRKWVADTVAEYRDGWRPVWEPCCGGLNSAEAHGGIVHCSDIDQSLISLYQGWQQGWRPPAVVTESDYRAARLLPETDPLHGFCAFGCAFGGKKWGGYARESGTRRNYAAGAARALARQIPKITSFSCVDFCSTDAEQIDAVIYLDPPYRGSTGFAHKFDHDKLVARAIEWSRVTTVLVSEYEFPVGRCVAELDRNLEIGKTGERRTERIYLL